MFCRLCALEKPHTIPIINENILDIDESDLNIDMKLKDLLSLEITENDNLPKVTCIECFTKLNNFNDFKTSVNKAQKVLKLIFIKPTESVEINEDGIENEHIINEENYFEQDDEKHEESEESYSKNDKNSEVTIFIDNNQDYDENGTWIELENCNTSKENQNNTCKIFNETEKNEDDKTISFYDDDSEVNESDNKNNVRTRHKIFRNLECFECTSICNSQKELTDHIKQKHGSNVKFRCTYCNQLFDKYRSFTRHVLNHTVQPRFSCDICNKSFAQKNGLNTHLLSHSDNRNFSCQICQQSFKQMSTLFNHKKIHATNKFSCEFCKQIFTSHTILTHHKKSKHLNIKDKICSICNKGYASNAALHYHKLTHKNLKANYECGICKKIFKNSSILRRHEVIHNLVNKSDSCDVCGKVYKSKTGLILHKKIHATAM